jgi:uncharacterized protein YggE
VKHVASLIFVLLASAAAAMAQTPPAADASLVVTMGEGVVRRAPDRVWITISAESRARNPQDAQKATADAMSAVMQKLKGSGLPADAIRTTAYDLQPEFDYANGRQTLRGYVARNAIEVRLDDVTNVGQTLELAVGSGATSVSGLRWDLRDRSGMEREALRLAVADARRRADAAASGAGVKVERIVRIEEHRASPVEPRPVMMAVRQEAAAAGQPPITPGELEVKATVVLTAAIR